MPKPSPIRTCVFPCAGFGTRFLPATKVVAKEMLPLVDKPVIQYGVEEAFASGITRMVMVTSRGKGAVVDHFHHTGELEPFLREKGKLELLEEVDRVNHLGDVIAVRQMEQLGLGHAVLMAESAVGDEAFAVLLPDDIVMADEPCLAQMMAMHRQTGAPIVSVRANASFFRSPVLMKWERGPEATNKKTSAAPESGGSRSAGGRV